MSIVGKKLAIAVLTAGTMASLGWTITTAQDFSGERFAESQYRHDVMKHFRFANRKIIQNLQGNVQLPEHFVPLANIMASAAQLTTGAFEKDTRGMEGKTKAKDNIWENWEDFSSRLEEFKADANSFAEVAQAGNMEQISPAFRKVVRHCKSCHDEYKAD